jgi:DNA helicase-2/ATP-dependent DNA helicase PcrA
MSHDYSCLLNDMQRSAVVTSEGPVLILAGAGSGKTRVLTYRIAYLISEKKVNPYNIMAVTFTNKAASEMRQRTADITGLKIAENSYLFQRGAPFIGTFHSLAAKILRQQSHLLGYDRGFAIYDSTEQLSLIKELFKELNFDDKKIAPRAALNRILSSKNELITVGKFQQKASDYFSETVAQVYEAYQKALKKNNAVDFNDLLMLTVELFQNFTDVLTEYQERFIYIMIDEYQDTNHAQYVLTKMLAHKYRNLCVVGDDWQGIYSWRGANISNILNFKHDYPEAVEIKLEQNYRSTKNILQAAQCIIDQNTNRTEKILWTDNETGHKIIVKEVFDEYHEGRIITETIKAEKNEYRDYAVLYRTNAQSRPLEEALLREGIPYRIVKGMKFYDRKEVKDILAYLSVIVNPHDSFSLRRIVNTPPRKIGKQTVDKVHRFETDYDLSLYDALMRADEMDLGKITVKRINAFLELLKRLTTYSSNHTVSETIEMAWEETGYKDFLLDGTEEGRERFGNVQELLSVAQKYDDIAVEFPFESFLQETALVSEIDSLDKSANAVSLMTLHSAKGLEFDYVFMTGMEEGIFPHANSFYNKASFEEERRLCYVGMTRAKKRLMLTYTQQRTLYGNFHHNPPSPYVTDIPEKLIQSFGPHDTMSKPSRVRKEKKKFSKAASTSPGVFKAGDKVEHSQFGRGVVIQSREGMLTVAFPSQGIKKLSAKAAPIEKVNDLT